MTTATATKPLTHSISMKKRKLADLESVFGKPWRRLWDHIKAETGSSIRKPGSIDLFTDARPLHLNDGECAKRFAWDLATGEISDSLHVSSGEWACHAGSNNDQGVTGLPSNTVIITVTWHEYYRYMSIDVQAHPAMIQAALAV